jgi:hypothetical protein
MLGTKQLEQFSSELTVTACDGDFHKLLLIISIYSGL